MIPEKGETRPCKTSLIMQEMVKGKSVHPSTTIDMLPVGIFLLGIVNTLKASVY